MDSITLKNSMVTASMAIGEMAIGVIKVTNQVQLHKDY